MTVHDLPPGQAISPYHFHWGDEGWLVVEYPDSDKIGVWGRHERVRGKRVGLESYEVAFDVEMVRASGAWSGISAPDRGFPALVLPERPHFDRA